MRMESTNQLGQFENADIFTAATQAAKEKRRYLKKDEVEARSVEIEDIEETVVNDIESVEEDKDSSVEAIETRKDKEARTKACLYKLHKHMNY